MIGCIPAIFAIFFALIGSEKFKIAVKNIGNLGEKIKIFISTRTEYGYWPVVLFNISIYDDMTSGFLFVFRKKIVYAKHVTNFSLLL